ncbi:flagellar hook-length control protein FliK [Methylobacterium sp. ARG-1]|uniref:flagellar hook-length control protein FliK n=1 Tax=Methylobacterium sp. ARG-1 TaxID=1692501 RepID=UPI001FCDFB1F|nr:flagellar hook-length control protein FliK [Methylobacterium sp. ARG-1]
MAARAGDSSQDRFGAALSAARARDDAAASRARVDARRDQADAARTASERARDASDTAKARAAARPEARPTNPARLAEARTQAPSLPPAEARPAKPMSRPETQGPAKPSDPTPAAGPGRTTDPTAQPASADAAGTPVRDAPSDATTLDAAKTDAAAADPAAAETAQAEAVPSEVPAQAPLQPTAPAVPGTVQALLAELIKGAPVQTKVVDGQDGEVGVTSTAASGTALADTSAVAAEAAGGKPGLAMIGAKTGAAPTAKGSGPGANPVEAVKAGEADPAGAEAASGMQAGQDFLAALADAGKGGASAGLLAPAPASPQGGPDPSALAPQAAVGTSPGVTHAAAPAPNPTQTRPDPAVPIGQVPMTIGLRSLAGSSEFQIRLDPAELGRIDVKLEIDKARGAVTTHLVVERPETLAMLQRDAGQLQQALSQAGLDPSGGGLNLSLRSDGNAQGGAGGGQGDAPRNGQAAWAQDRAEAPQETAPTRWLRGYGGLDIRI